MTVRIERRGGKLVVDVRTRGPDGQAIRERRNAPDGVTSPSGAKRWGERRQAFLASNGLVETKESPFFKDFADRWMIDYCKAERLKPSTIDAYERILRLHLTSLDRLRLDEIREPEIQRVKVALGKKSAKTGACVLSVLAEVLGAAHNWGELETVPKIEKPRWFDPEMDFYSAEEWDALIAGAEKAGPMVLCAVLLGGDAGLRRGELVALEVADCRGGQVRVLRSEWQGHVGTPKGGKSRVIPATSRLAAALQGSAHLRGKRLFWQENGKPVTATTLQGWLEMACRKAGLPESRNIHKLRHTFCSHLAMKGAPPKAIQELAGHADLKTTMRYMHLSPGSKEAAIALLERGAGGERRSEKGSG